MVKIRPTADFFIFIKCGGIICLKNKNSLPSKDKLFISIFSDNL